MKAANESAKELKRKNIAEFFDGNKVGIIWMGTNWGGAFHLSTANICWFGYSLVWLLIWMVVWEYLYWNSIFLLMIWNNHLDFLEQDSHTHTHPCFSWISDIIFVSVRCFLCIFLFCWFHYNFSSKSSWLHCAGCFLCQFVTKRGRSLVISFPSVRVRYSICCLAWFDFLLSIGTLWEFVLNLVSGCLGFRGRCFIKSFD